MKMCICAGHGHHERTGASLMLTPESSVRGTGSIRLPVENRHEKEFLSSCKGLPSDVKRRRREAAAAVDDGVGEGVAPLPRGPLGERRPQVIPRSRHNTLTDVERCGEHRRVHGLYKDGIGEKGTIEPIPMHADNACCTGARAAQDSESKHGNNARPVAISAQEDAIQSGA